MKTQTFTRTFRDQTFEVKEYRLSKSNALAAIHYILDRHGRRVFISFTLGVGYLWQICPWPLDSATFCHDSRQLGFKPENLDQALDQVLACEAENF